MATSSDDSQERRGTRSREPHAAPDWNILAADTLDRAPEVAGRGLERPTAPGHLPAGTREAAPLLIVPVAVAVPVVLVVLAAAGGGTPLLVLALVAMVIASAGIAASFARLSTGGESRDETDVPGPVEVPGLRQSATRGREPLNAARRSA